MKLLADERVDGPVVERIRAEGHDVGWIAEDTPGLADDAVPARWTRLVLSADAFGDCCPPGRRVQ